jgi:chromosome segregation ATPase
MSDPLQFSGGDTAGISEADQREIREEIERVAAENRIQVSDDLLEYTPQRNGATFPIVANLAGLLLLGAGILVLFLLFQSEDASIRSAEQSVMATESRLIQELRRETEAQLAEKEAEIEQIVARLESISRERAELARDIEEQIRQREAELEEQFQAELEAERRRLQALNLTEAEIEVRLAEFETQKRQEYNARLAAFQDRMLAERERLEEDLDALESQFNQTLEQASQERQAILQESEARISELQSEFQARLNQSEAELSAAQRELNRLARSRDRETLVRGQITGLYGRISENLQEAEYDAALENLDTLESLLNEAETFQVEALREERATNLFMARTLREYIRNIEDTNNPETLARLSDASLVRRAEELRDEAEAALREGNQELARTLYRQALETIPAVAESFAYFESRGTAADREAATTENEAAAALVADAEAAAQAEDHRLAVENFAQVVQLYPETIYRGRAINGILTSVEELQAGLDEEIEALTAERDALELAVQETTVVTEEEVEQLREERETQEVRIVRLEGRIDNLQTQRSALETQRETLRGQMRTLREQRDTSQERAEELESRVRELDTEIRELETTIVERDQELAESRREQALLNEQLATVAEGGTADPEILEELAELRDVSRDLAAAERLYREYLDRIEELGSQPQGVEIVEARLKLDEFLASPQLDQYFPDLEDEVGRYESAYEESGRENAMVEVADFIYELSLLDSTADRLRRIRRERLTTDEQLMRDFLDELQLLLEG